MAIGDKKTRQIDQGLQVDYISTRLDAAGNDVWTLVSSTDTSETIEAITTSDSTDFSASPRAIYVGGAGNISVYTSANTTVVFNNCQAGTVLPIKVKRVNTTGTTATNLIALY